MGKEKNRPSEVVRMSKTELADRLQALQTSGATGSSPSLIRDARETELQAVLHELEVYQIELEMQNRELRESRQIVEESHDRFVSLYDFAPVGYLTLSDKGVIQEANLTVAKMLGIERRWLIRRSLSPWIERTDLVSYREHLKKCTHDEQEEAVCTALHLRDRNKKSIPVELVSRVVVHPTSGERQYWTTIMDMSEKKRVEEERDRFFKLSADLLCVIREDGVFERISPSWGDALGYSLETLRTQSFLKVVHPDDRESTYSVFQNALRCGKFKNGFLNRFIRADRSIVDMAWSGTVSHGRFYGVARDVTRETLKRREAENRYEWVNEMIQAIPIPLTLADASTGDLLMVSAQVGVLLPGLPMDGVEARRSRSCYFTDAQGKRLPADEWPRYRTTTGVPFDGELLTWHAAGKKRHLMVWSRLIPAKFDHPEMVLIMFQDIQTLLDQKSQLKEVVDQLKQERSLREDFVAALSHDLLTPLTAARIGMELLSSKGLDAVTVTKIRANSLRSIDRVDRMIHDLLDANRLQSGEPMPLKKTRFDLVRLVRATLGGLAEVHGNQFVINAAASLVGRWSKNHIRRVIENLVNNAVKYGASRELITVCVELKGEGQVALCVHNWGDAIPPEDQEAIFDQYRRTGSANHGGHRGWGVGLSLVRGIVEAHGGRISLVSEPELGTIFTVVLPNGVK